MSRKSSAALAIAPLTAIRRIGPPRGLTDFQRNVWLATVNSKPAEWFSDEHVPLLVEYVRHVETADILSREIDAFDPAWRQDDDGLKRFDRLTAIRTREATLIHNLARSMRLTQQALYRADKAATLDEKSKGRKPWQG